MALSTSLHCITGHDLDIGRHQIRGLVPIDTPCQGCALNIRLIGRRAASISFLFILLQSSCACLRIDGLTIVRSGKVWINSMTHPQLGRVSA